MIEAGDALEIPIRFRPTSIGAKTATITIDSDDRLGARTIAVSGDVPLGKLAITGSNVFSGVNAHCCADRTISICNVGGCDPHVSSVGLKRKSALWKLLNNPFPATLQLGSCLGQTIRYKVTEKCARCCELLIASGPASPHTIEVSGEAPAGSSRPRNGKVDGAPTDPSLPATSMATAKPMS